MRFIRPYKLTSGALQLTIFIGVIVALILAGLLLLGYSHRSLTYQARAGIEVVRACDDGIRYLCTSNHPQGDTLVLIQPEEQQQGRPEVKVHLSRWGIFSKAMVTATHRKKKFSKAALLGGMGKGARIALYLQETFTPLAVVGGTQINGNAALPQMGIKPGYIAGNSFYGEKLLRGEVGVSAKELPLLQIAVKDQVKYYLEEYPPVAYKDLVSLTDKRKQINSFGSPVKGYSSAQPIVLADVSLQGNIIIRSSTRIKVRKSAHLKDVILAAPAVELEDGVEGAFQVFASQSIICGKGCRLDYPSALVLAPTPKEQDRPFDQNRNKINISENCVLRGILAYDAPLDAKGYLSNIYIDTAAKMAGELYCNGNLELRGKVYGTVYTKQLVVNEAGTVYLNHLYNAVIDPQKLPEQYVGLLFTDIPKDVAKWLY